MKLQEQTKNRYTAYELAFCAILSALGTVIMLTGGLIPILTYCSPLLASILLVPVLREFGKGKAIAVWAVTAALSLLLCPDREAALFYCFIGGWPILRIRLEKLPGKVLPWVGKLLAATFLICAMYGLACFVFGISEIQESFSPWMWLNAAIIAVLVVSVLIFDVVVKRMDLLYWNRLRSKWNIDRYLKGRNRS